jgi:hypothetical protein
VVRVRWFVLDRHIGTDTGRVVLAPAVERPLYGVMSAFSAALHAHGPLVGTSLTRTRDLRRAHHPSRWLTSSALTRTCGGYRR